MAYGVQFFFIDGLVICLKETVKWWDPSRKEGETKV